MASEIINEINISCYTEYKAFGPSLIYNIKAKMNIKEANKKRLFLQKYCFDSDFNQIFNYVHWTHCFKINTLGRRGTNTHSHTYTHTKAMRKTFFWIFVFRERRNRLFSIFEFNPEFIQYFCIHENFAKQMRKQMRNSKYGNTYKNNC